MEVNKSFGYGSDLHVEFSRYLGVQQGDRLELVAPARLVVAPHPGEALLDCALAAEAAHDEKVDTVFQRSSSLLQTIVDAAHQFLTCNDEAFSLHSSDDSKVVAVYDNVETFRFCRLRDCVDDLVVVIAID